MSDSSSVSVSVVPRDTFIAISGFYLLFSLYFMVNCTVINQNFSNLFFAANISGLNWKFLKLSLMTNPNVPVQPCVLNVK